MLPDLKVLDQSVQSFPKGKEAYPDTIFMDSARTVLLPAFGTKERDRVLRTWYRSDYNNLFQGAASGLIKKVTSATYELVGGRNLVNRFRPVLQFSQFGEGWKALLGRFLMDYLTQDFGAVMELIGPGAPDTELTGAVTGLAHLDAGRCWATDNPVYPILYWSRYSGKTHLMHASRVYRMVDTPDGDEKFRGNGLCALSRAIAIVKAETLQGRYIEMSLDDKPKPGITVASGMNEQGRDHALAMYRKDQAGPEGDIWGRNMWFYSISADLPIKVENITFAQAPVNFDLSKYTDLHVNAIALALGVDRQELWELGGAGVGTSTQSKTLHQKSQGKAFADILTGIERLINLAVLPDGVIFSFQARDPQADEAQAQVDLTYMQTAALMASSGKFSDDEIRTTVANATPTFKRAMTDSQGQVNAFDAVDSNLPVDPSKLARSDTPVQQQTAAQSEPAIPAKADAAASNLTKKDYAGTREFFVKELASATKAAAGRSLTKAAFVRQMRALLRSSGTDAYKDGLAEGGVDDPLDADEQHQINAWLIEQDRYIKSYADDIYADKVGAADAEKRANLWANKSLQTVHQYGVMSADANGMYQWQMGATEHCIDCLALNGQKHRMTDWTKSGWLPQATKLECEGFECECKLTKVSGKATSKMPHVKARSNLYKGLTPAWKVARA